MADDGFRDRMSKQGEEALGKLATDLLENPLVNSAITRDSPPGRRPCRRRKPRWARSTCPRGGHRPPHTPAAHREHAARGHRGVAGPPPGRRRPLSAKLGSDAALAERLTALEGQLSKLVHDVSHVPHTIDAVPPPVPREQERLAVDAPSPKPARKRGSEEEVLLRFGEHGQKDKDKKKKANKGSDDPVAALRAAAESTLRASAEAPT